MVMCGIEVLYVSAADLQRRIDVQVLVERRYGALGLARGIVEFRMGTVLEFGNVRRTTVVHHQTDVLYVGKRKLVTGNRRRKPET